MHQHGPFPCGSHPDSKIYKLGLKGKLNKWEKVWADRGYRGDVTVTTLYDSLSRGRNKEMSRARARHETINGRFTKWGILKRIWRHSLTKHWMVYFSMAEITQVEHINGFSSFQCIALNQPRIQPV
jgi:muconolactone delta-isomerase